MRKPAVYIRLVRVYDVGVFLDRRKLINPAVTSKIQYFVAWTSSECRDKVHETECHAFGPPTAIKVDRMCIRVIDVSFIVEIRENCCARM